MDEIYRKRRESLALALESGAYNQACGALRRTDESGYCCLGVAEDVRMHEDSTAEKWGPNGGILCADGYQHAVLTQITAQWYGWEQNPKVCSKQQVLDLFGETLDEIQSSRLELFTLNESINMIQLNDTFNLSFVQIAKIIREFNLE